MGTYVWNTSSTPNKINDSSSSNINRIYVDPTIKKGIILDELSLPYNEKSNKKLDDKYIMGISYPVICINNNFLNSDEILLMEISCEKFIPSIHLEISPKSENLIIKDPPKDGDIISVFIRTTTDVIVPLRCDFIIKNNNSGDKMVTNRTAISKLILDGTLFIPGLNSQIKSFGDFGTSKDALKSVAKQLRLGFATNDMNDLNDKQIWICPKTNIESYIKDIESHAWRDEQSFYKTWIDIYYNLNYINVNESLMSSDDDIDITAYSTTIDFQKLYPIDTSQNNAQEFPKLFNNIINEMRKSPFFILNWSIVNNSSKITNKIGSKINTFVFVHNQNLYNDDKNPYMTLENNQMYDPKKIDSHIILRGRTTYDSSNSGENEMARENIKTDDINTHNKWGGIQYTMSDTDNEDTNLSSGNVHLNYNRAESHNKLNKKELDKMYIKLTVSGACLQVMRGEKVPVIIKNTPGITTDIMDAETEMNIPVNKMYSGMYFVDGYKIIFKPKIHKNGEGYSNFYTEFILKRREWPAPVAIQKE